MSKTKELADRLGLTRRRKLESKSCSISSDDRSGKLKYLLVIDFESTCWKEKAGAPPPEVIEFPVVVLCLVTGNVVDEFQQFVMPLENPRLSAFCTELTGIKQNQVDDGVPISTCLVLFSQWLREVCEERNIDVNQEVTCLTWSDWDLKVCLENECRRKQIRKPQVLSSWVDIRAVYREFYKRKPQGLNGALRELGLSFEGREHSGIEDARNTARLVWRMIQDGWKPRVDKPQEGWRGDIDKHRVQKPSTSAISRPSTSNVLKPSNCGISKPISRPSISSTSGISIPSSSGSSRPSNSSTSGISRPSTSFSSGISRPSTSFSSGISRPSKPLSSAASVASNARISKPSSTSTSKFANSGGPNPSTVKLEEKLSSAPEALPNVPNTTTTNSTIKIQSVNTPINDLKKSGSRQICDTFKTPVLKRTLGNVPMPVRKGQTQPNDAITPETNSLRQTVIPKYLNIPYKTPERRSCSSLQTPLKRPSPDGTPPLCQCGRRTRKHMAWRPGPNQGRIFFSCTLGSRLNKTGCKFFVWAEGSNRL